MVSYKKEGMTSPAVSGALYGSQEWRKKKSWTEKTEIPHRPNTSWASTEEGLEQTNADPNNQSYAKNCKQSKSERKVTNRQVMPTPILSTMMRLASSMYRVHLGVLKSGMRHCGYRRDETCSLR